jgi:hypothetical protein
LPVSSTKDRILGYDTQRRVWIAHPNVVYALRILPYVFKTARSEWKCGTVQIFGNDYNTSKPDSGGNEVEIELG